MATPFQPDKPYPSDKKSEGRSAYVVVAIVAGMLVMMIFDLLAPRLFEDEGIGWLISFLIGAAVFAVIMIWGWVRGRNNQGTAE
ncbi:MAG TPA: hypothetical protein VFG50_08445 [Rhodothermales bacterium]|nr:hypothetical protein [Rhodothermales bacterium]